jgi:hypothetical protein
MRTSIVKVNRQPVGVIFWISMIKELQDNRFTVRMDFKTKADLNIILSGQFENPVGYTGKRVMVLNKNEWVPRQGNAWDKMYGDIVKHYYDDIIDVTKLSPKQAAIKVIDYIYAEERKADKRGS